VQIRLSKIILFMGTILPDTNEQGDSTTRRRGTHRGY
jgi:hypothetical protein